MVDFHSHILPGMDDGAKDVFESLALLEESKRQGIAALVATPHFYPENESPDSFIERCEAAALKLSEAYDSEKHPTVFLGAEVAYYNGISRSKEIEKLCIHGTRLILIEMPFCKWTEKMISELIAMRENMEVIPVLAHIERYPAIRDKKLIYKLIANGIIIQANASFFIRSATRRKAIKKLFKNEIQLLGSDLHNRDSRPQNMASALEMIEKKLGRDTVDLLSAFSTAILKGARPITKGQD